MKVTKRLDGKTLLLVVFEFHPIRNKLLYQDLVRNEPKQTNPEREKTGSSSFSFGPVDSSSGRIRSGNESSFQLILLLLPELVGDAERQLLHSLHRLSRIPEI